jgi:hypothetical protein
LLLVMILIVSCTLAALEEWLVWVSGWSGAPILEPRADVQIVQGHSLTMHRRNEMERHSSGQNLLAEEDLSRQVVNFTIQSQS